MSYEDLSVDQLFAKIEAELPHASKFEDAAKMWDEARVWIDDKIARFRGEVQDLRDQQGWKDGAGDLFAARTEKDLESLRSWTQATAEVQGAPYTQAGLINGEVKSNVAYTLGITRSNVADRLRTLAGDIRTTYNNLKLLRDDFHQKYDGDNRLKVENEPLYRQKMATELNLLGISYVALYTWVLPQATGADWSGPRAHLPSTTSPAPSSTGDGTSTSGTGTDGAGTPAEPATPAEPVTPVSPDTTEEQDSPQSLMNAASSLLDSGSKAIEAASGLLGQLGGSGTDIGGELGRLEPGKLSPLAPLPDPLGSVGLPSDSSGLPSLAGLDAGAAGIGGGAGGGVPSATGSVPMSGTAGLGASMPGAPLPSIGTTAGAAGTSRAAGSGMAGPGMMPAMHSPQAGGGSSSGGVRPGAAEQVNAVRSRKPDSTPGVSLRGRTGRANATTPPPAAERRWDGENTVQLLDEELWQVGPTGHDEPKYRSGQ
ncbi:hypothetical protein [Amycolatopsis sp. cmx-11-12]|uniref:hypothetical protein n=1 Tax=Amycolatopsis sp. cmx-11-12 TaxID=2785795 RepID=UPI0039175C7E